MGKRAARIGDTHVCPKETPGTPPVPHLGGPVISGSLTVFIDGQPAARVGDLCTCVGEPDKITTGSTGVFIEGQPAARKGDSTAHGGKVTFGSMTVRIGEKKIPRVLQKIRELSPEEKARVINEAIERSIILLERKLELLEQNDFDTLEAFKRWFGREDEESRRLILEMMRKALDVSKKLSTDNFEEFVDEKEKRETCAIIYAEDSPCKVKVGDMFWKTGTEGEMLRSGTIIHELSHIESVGGTEDVIYGEKDCLELAIKDPAGALKNADSFEFFVIV